MSNLYHHYLLPKVQQFVKIETRVSVQGVYFSFSFKFRLNDLPKMLVKYIIKCVTFNFYCLYMELLKFLTRNVFRIVEIVIRIFNHIPSFFADIVAIRIQVFVCLPSY